MCPPTPSWANVVDSEIGNLLLTNAHVVRDAERVAVFFPGESKALMGKVLAADAVQLDSAKTVQGQEVRIDASSGVKIDDANVIATDLIASNGVIHVIDTVIIPN